MMDWLKTEVNYWKSEGTISETQSNSIISQYDSLADSEQKKNYSLLYLNQCCIDTHRRRTSFINRLQLGSAQLHCKARHNIWHHHIISMLNSGLAVWLEKQRSF